MPTYSGNRRTQGGREPFHWAVPEMRSSECPVSAITPRSFELVRIVNIMQGAKDSAGAVSADALPGYVLDAARICLSEKRTAEAAMDEALNQ